VYRLPFLTPITSTATETTTTSTSTYTNPFDTLLEQTGDLPLPYGVYQLSSGMMRRDQLHTIDKAIEFLQTDVKHSHYCIELPEKPLDSDLAEEHDIPAPPNGPLGLVPENGQRVPEEQMLH
jgi:hypothetical protein